jgi:hypothetical protein
MELKQHISKVLSGLGLAVLLMTVPSSAWATPSYCDSIGGNLVANCGFELGNFTSWAVTDGSPATALFISTEPSQPVNSGTYAATFTANATSTSDVDTITQTLATVAGSSYTFAFYLDVVPCCTGVPSGEYVFQADWNGTQELNLTSTSTIASGYQLYTYAVTATSSSTVIQFDGSDPNGYNNLDDVVVTVQGSSAVPEPVSMLLMGAGLAGLAMVRRR